jgi:hypothetical protein
VHSPQITAALYPSALSKDTETVVATTIKAAAIKLPAIALQIPRK